MKADMRAVLLKSPKTLKVERLPVPSLEPGWALVKVKACGICGSDLRYYLGENPWALHTLGYNKPSPPNINLGHEIAGEIVAVADEMARDRIGERVGVLAFKTCGHCPDCLNDDPNLCADMLHIGHGAGWGERDYYPGGMSEYCQIPLACCVTMPDSLSFEEAACADFVAVATHAVRLAGPIYNRQVAVIGAGPVGNSIAQVARSQGAIVHVLEASANARKVLAAQSFERVWALEQEGEFFAHNRGACTAVWDSVGSARSVETGLQLLRSKGRLINLATHDVEVPLNMTLLSKERAILSSANCRNEDHPSALWAMANKLVDARSMISSTIALEEVPAMFTSLLSEEKSGQFKVIVDPERNG